MNKRPILRRRLSPWILATFLAVNLWGAKPNSPAAESMSGFAKAIELEEQLSFEQSEWNQQKRLLENEIEVLNSELAETLRRIESIQSERTRNQERREELVARLSEEKSLARDLTRMIEKITTPSQSLLASIPSWSAAWREDPEPISAESSPVDVLRALQEIQAENSQIQVRPTEVTDPDSGEAFRVDLLTFGLGAAFFATEDGNFGGRFVFDGEQWSPEIIPQYAGPILEAILQERGATEPEFTILPISLSGTR
ncbi:MAG: DUF3450 family protein [Puniceicoccales bacterium]